MTIKRDDVSTRTCLTVICPLTGRSKVLVIDDKGQEIKIAEEVKPSVEDCSDVTGWE